MQVPQQPDRQAIIQELRHRLRYSSGEEKAAIYSSLDFWLRYNPDQYEQSEEGFELVTPPKPDLDPQPQTSHFSLQWLINCFQF